MWLVIIVAAVIRHKQELVTFCHTFRLRVKHSSTVDSLEYNYNYNSTSGLMALQLQPVRQQGFRCNLRRLLSELVRTDVDPAGCSGRRRRLRAAMLGLQVQTLGRAGRPMNGRFRKRPHRACSPQSGANPVP